MLGGGCGVGSNMVVSKFSIFQYFQYFSVLSVIVGIVSAFRYLCPFGQ